MRVASLLAVLPWTISAFTLHERMLAAPTGWAQASEPNADDLMTLQVALIQPNTPQMISRLNEVSDPDHPDYGEYMDKEELDDLMRAPAASNDAVVEWLKKSGVEYVHSDGNWVTFQTTISHANQLLNTKFMNYKKNDVTRLRTTEYSLPADIAPHVDLVTPTTYFGRADRATPVFHQVDRASQLEARQQASPSCAGAITPDCVRQLYNVGDYVPNPKSGSKIAFGSFLNQSAQQFDLQQYETFFNIPSQSFSVETITGGTNNQPGVDDQNAPAEDVGEANLDVQNIIGVAHPLPVTEYITGGMPPFQPDINIPNASVNTNEPYFEYYRYLLAKTNAELPQVISNSYGDIEQTVPEKYAQRVCNQIAQIGMRGVTVLESSGDVGVGAGCRSNDGLNRPVYEPTFPASCPYVLSIGGTQAINPEVAWTNGSGGFSNYFPAPSYQKAAVNRYLNQELPQQYVKSHQKYFNRNGRGFPDVSAHSLNPRYLIINKARPSFTGGTSAAAPVWAALLSLLNDARLQAGRPSFGFINPWMYKTGVRSLIDVTQGASVGCNGINAQSGTPVPGGGIIPNARWAATPGWDAVTGLGIPNFQKLLRAALA